MSSLGRMVHRSAEGALIRQARLYDALVGVVTLGGERRFREATLDLVGLSAGERVLDVGCGTGTLAIGAKRQVGEAGVVHAVDASAEMIALARRKADRSGAAVHLQIGRAQALPFDDSTFDAVVCTMVMHHLPRDVRANAAARCTGYYSRADDCWLSTSLAKAAFWPDSIRSPCFTARSRSTRLWRSGR